jgi:hypothetical protein
MMGGTQVLRFMFGRCVTGKAIFIAFMSWWMNSEKVWEVEST